MPEPLVPPARVVVEDRGHATPCWIWTGAKTSAGYGAKRVDGRVRLTHLIGYEEAHGPIPAGCEVDHLCKQTLCRRGSHLEAVSHAENIRRGRSSKITMAIAREIRRLRGGGAKPKELAAQFGIDSTTVIHICAGRAWREPA